MEHEPIKPTNEAPVRQTMAEVVSKLHPDLQAKTRIVPKISKEEMEQLILKSNKNLGKSAGHTTRY